LRWPFFYFESEEDDSIFFWMFVVFIGYSPQWKFLSRRLIDGMSIKNIQPFYRIL